jgi:membrane protein DedA with SNARE-associated domain
MTIIDTVVEWYSAHIDYASITALMTVESSFIPFPSEVVIPPAVYVASEPTSALCTTGIYPIDVLLIILFGTLGAMIGAVINYGLSVWLGRKIVYAFADSRLGRMCLLSSEKIENAEQYFNQKGNISTFVGRFIPGIRQLISIPAGLSRMPFGSFLLYTFLGAFSWNCILALIGYVAHGQMDIIQKYSYELSVAILVIVAIVAVVWIAKKFIFSRKN